MVATQEPLVYPLLRGFCRESSASECRARGPGYNEAVKEFVWRTIRAMRLLARDSRIPKPLRWIAGIGLLPIPGPFDEALLVLIAPVSYTHLTLPTNREV